jgi:putative membrane protein
MKSATVCCRDVLDGTAPGSAYPWRSMIDGPPFNATTKPSHMMDNLTPFLLHWGITALSLWVASHIFHGIKFADTGSLIVSALLLGFANAIVKPLLIVLTLPLTLVTFGLFLLVINALMILLVSSLVKGFTVSSFWTAFFAAIFIAVLSFVIGSFVLGGGSSHSIQMPHSNVWL